jgi:parallel beta-helix repeat protein
LRTGILIFILLFSLAFDVKARDYYVAKNGNDGNNGSEITPWRTIQKAANIMTSGDTVNVLSGTYNELVTVKRSGSNLGFITFQSSNGHKVILDGTGNPGWHGILNIHGKAYIRVRNIEIRNNSVGWGVLIEHDLGNVNKAATQIELSGLHVHNTGGEGIQVRGNVKEVIIRDCVVHDSKSQSGIDIYKWNGGRPQHVLVRGCKTYNCTNFAGIASEQADFLLIENNVSYRNGIGIDIGSGDNNVIRNNHVFESKTGIALSSNEDSEVYGNTIHDIDDEAIYSYYWSKHGEAHARNKWYRNIIYNAGFGIFESNSRPRAGEGRSSDHQYYNNLFYNIGKHGSYRVPVFFNRVTGVKFYNNTIYMNADYDGLHFVNGSTNADIRNNIISVSGKKTPVIMDGPSSLGSVIDFNCYDNRAGVAKGPGTHSLSGDPRFADPIAGKFRLLSLSPCIDAGTTGEGIPRNDIEGHSRCKYHGRPRDKDIVASHIDIGAYEYPCDTNSSK